MLRNVLHQHCHWRGWPLIIPFHSVPIVNPGKVQGATRDLRILSTAINKKLPAAGDGLDSKYGVVCTSVKINWTTVRVNRITAPRNERDCPTKRINEYLKAISLGLPFKPLSLSFHAHSFEIKYREGFYYTALCKRIRDLNRRRRKKKETQLSTF